MSIKNKIKTQISKNCISVIEANVTHESQTDISEYTIRFAIVQCYIGRIPLF